MWQRNVAISLRYQRNYTNVSVWISTAITERSLDQSIRANNLCVISLSERRCAVIYEFGVLCCTNHNIMRGIIPAWQMLINTIAMF